MGAGLFISRILDFQPFRTPQHMQGNFYVVERLGKISFVIKNILYIVEPFIFTIFKASKSKGVVLQSAFEKQRVSVPCNKGCTSHARQLLLAGTDSKCDTKGFVSCRRAPSTYVHHLTPPATQLYCLSATTLRTCCQDVPALVASTDFSRNSTSSRWQFPFIMRQRVQMSSLYSVRYSLNSFKSSPVSAASSGACCSLRHTTCSNGTRMSMHTHDPHNQ